MLRCRSRQERRARVLQRPVVRRSQSLIGSVPEVVVLGPVDRNLRRHVSPLSVVRVANRALASTLRPWPLEICTLAGISANPNWHPLSKDDGQKRPRDVRI